MDKRKAFIVLAIFGGMVALASCERGSVESAAAREIRHDQELADRVVSHILYIRDQRTVRPVCFAFASEEVAYAPAGASAVMATVPCEDIPPELLITSTVK